MTAPHTLLAMAGAPLDPSPLDRAALVVIDHQKEYTEGRLPLEGIDAAVAEVGALLALARRSGVPVFHIVQHGKPGGLFDPEGPTGAIVPGLAPLDGEATVVKRLPNAFAGTDLHERLTATGRSELIVAGFMTHMCVSSSVRAAFDLGWRLTVAAGATATRALPDALGGVIPAAEVQRASLAAMADRFAVVVGDHRAWA